MAWKAQRFESWKTINIGWNLPRMVYRGASALVRMTPREPLPKRHQTDQVIER
jgi:hypothetical protein